MLCGSAALPPGLNTPPCFAEATSKGSEPPEGGRQSVAAKYTSFLRVAFCVSGRSKQTEGGLLVGNLATCKLF